MNDRNGKMLSVVVPIYGVGDYLETCIDSIIAQTYRHLEIILVDDGAKGREPEICDEYAKKDGRIKVIHKKNAGVVAARKTGVDYSTADYIVFIDGDDYIDLTLYEKMMQYINNDDVDLVAVSYTMVANNKTEKRIQGIDNGVYELNKLSWLRQNMNCKDGKFYTFGIWPSTCLKIYKTELLKRTMKGIPEGIRMGEDVAVTFPYILNCNKIVIDNSIVGYQYRVLSQSMSKTCDESLLIGADLLYKYLRPFYAKSCDVNIIIQLEYLRAYLIYIGLNLWMSDTTFQDIGHRVNRVKSIIERTDLFNEAGILLCLNIPKMLYDSIYAISCHDWKGFERLWRRKLVLSCLHTMARKLLRKV